MRQISSQASPLCTAPPWLHSPRDGSSKETPALTLRADEICLARTAGCAPDPHALLDAARQPRSSSKHACRAGVNCCVVSLLHSPPTTKGLISLFFSSRTSIPGQSATPAKERRSSALAAPARPQAAAGPSPAPSWRAALVVSYSPPSLMRHPSGGNTAPLLAEKTTSSFSRPASPGASIFLITNSTGKVPEQASPRISSASLPPSSN